MAKSENLGMSPAIVRGLSASMGANTAMLEGIAHEIAQTGRASRSPSLFGLIPGYNQAMTMGSIALAESAASDVRFAIASANDLIGRLSAQVQEQIDASSAREGYLDGLMSKNQADALYNKVMADPSALDHLSPQQVAAWWERLDAAQREAFATEQHWVAGNTNGIPFTVRIEANRLSALEMLEDPRITGAQRQYLEVVAHGDQNGVHVQLISFDPAADRIIEMVGTLSDRTTNIVEYMPGTMASMDGFYSGETQQMVHNLVKNAVPPGSTVGFVYKDSPFPTFAPDGVYNSSWAAEVGGPYHDFNTALGLENTRGADVISIEHSFGSSGGGYAEMQGTHFDQRIVLGGIGMPDGWTQQPGTEYHSFTGPDDVIRLAREQGSDSLNLGYPHPPTEASGFTEHETGFEDNGFPSIAEHTRVAGVEDNHEVLGGIRGIIGR